MALFRVGPQRVEHTDGWALGSHDREHLKYEAGDRIAFVGVNHGLDGTRVYTRGLVWRLEDGSSSVPTAEEQAVIWPRIVAGMEALDLPPELFDG